MKILILLTGILFITSCSKTPEFYAKEEFAMSNDKSSVDTGSGNAPNIPSDDPSSNPPVVVTPPVVITPPVTQPPVVVSPPVTQPPVVVSPPVTQPPVVVSPPVTQPPVTTTPPIADAPNPAPIKVGPLVELGSAAQSCKYNFKATHVAEGVNVTIISGSLNSLSKITDFAYSKLSTDDKAFILDALANRLTLPIVSNVKSTAQSISDKTLVQNTNEASITLTSIQQDVNLNYALRGKTAVIKAQSVAENSKIIAVLEGEKSNVDFTSLGKNAKVFLVYITSGDNITCISTTGVAGNMHSYVYGDEGNSTQSQVNTTAIKGSSIIQYVSGRANTRAFLKGTSISDSKVNIKVEGAGMNVGSINNFTGMGNSNTFDILINGQDQSNLSLKGTCAGKNNMINLNVVGNKDTNAQFGFTNESNVKIFGTIAGISPKLSMSENLLHSQTATVNITKVEK